MEKKGGKECKSVTGKGTYRRRIVGLLLWVTALAFFGCGNRAESSVEENMGVEAVMGMETEPNGQGKADEKDAGGTAGTGETGKRTDAGTDASGEERITEGTETGEADAEEESPWSGKKLSVCGDSISTFTGHIPEYYSKFYPECGEIQAVEETWWMQVAERTGMELCSNASYSGSTVSGQSQDNHEGAYACGNQRIADLAGPEGEWPDVILILLGANDLLNGIPLGAYDGVSQVQEGYIQNFSEAYGLMLDKMKMWYPDAEIYCCTILEAARWDDEGNCFPFQNEHGLTAKNYNDCIKAVAQAKGISVLDVYGCGITYENIREYTSDGTHPNPAGAILIADKVCEELGVN